MYSAGAVMDLVWQMHRLLVNLPNFRVVLANSLNLLSRSVVCNVGKSPPGCNFMCYWGDFVIYQI